MFWGGTLSEFILRYKNLLKKGHRRIDSKRLLPRGRRNGLRKPYVDLKGCYRAMHPKTSQITRQEALAAKRDRYARAGKEHKTQIINELVELFGCHRKAAIRASRA
jgi:hypothetical protein